MFRGTSLLTIDAKGRIAVPSRYRERLLNKFGPALVVTPNPFEQTTNNASKGPACLIAYPLQLWEMIEQKVLKKPRAPYRYMVANAQECEMDNQGRVLVPSILREQAQLGKHLQLIGRITRFELWREDIWSQRNNELLDATNGMSEADRQIALDDLDHEYEPR